MHEDSDQANTWAQHAAGWKSNAQKSEEQALEQKAAVSTSCCVTQLQCHPAVLSPSCGGT